MIAARALAGLAVLLCALAPLAVGAHAQPIPKPQVLIVTTGGTIASRKAGPMTEGGTLVGAIPELAKYASVQVEEFTRVASSQMTPDHWVRLAKRINAGFKADAGLAAIVVTHGTDTMEETAFFLNLTVHDARPVVVVGAMRSSDEISADGPANLLNGVRVAVSHGAVGQGVLVVLNEDIGDARDVWKTDNRRVNTFRSPELGFLGFADPDTVMFYRTVTRPHTTSTEFDVATIDTLPPVDMLTDYAGFDSTLMRAALARKPRGIVLTSFAGGRLSAGGRAALRIAAQAGVPVVVASRVPGGRIVGNPLGDLPGVLARDLPPHKARVLLMLALTRSTELRGIQRIFDTY